MSDGIAHHVVPASTLSHRHRFRLRSSESYWVRGLIAAAGEPRIRGDVANPRKSPSLAYVYGHETRNEADIAKVLGVDEARRIASNIAKLPIASRLLTLTTF